MAEDADIGSGRFEENARTILRQGNCFCYFYADLGFCIHFQEGILRHSLMQAQAVLVAISSL